MANKAIRYRIYPTNKQKDLLARTFGCCRKVWNLMLADKISCYEATGKNLLTTPAQYKKEYPFLKEVDSLALANVQMSLQKAYNSFFKKKTGFPKFKSAKRSRKAYTTNNQKGSVAVLENGIKLPKLGKVKAVIHRIPEPEWKLKSATVSQESDGSYYVSVLFEYEREPVSVDVNTSNAVGLDYKSDGLYVDSEGSCCDMPHFYRKSQKKLSRAQRKLSRRVGSGKGETKSKNYLKQLAKLNRIHRKTADQRKDFLHKESTKIANSYGIVCVEDLNMKSLSNKGFGNGKATLDNGYGMFLSMLEYKLKDKGGHLVRVDRWYASSQTCSCCGYKNPEVKDLRIRKWTCPVCGTTHDRDVNAAVNIKNEGLRLLLSA